MTPETTQLVDHLEWGMAIICNAGGGDWTKETKDWQEAARKWVDTYGPLVAPLSAAKSRQIEVNLVIPPLPANHSFTIPIIHKQGKMTTRDTAEFVELPPVEEPDSPYIFNKTVDSVLIVTGFLCWFTVMILSIAHGIIYLFKL